MNQSSNYTWLQIGLLIVIQSIITICSVFYALKTHEINVDVQCEQVRSKLG